MATHKKRVGRRKLRFTPRPFRRLLHIVSAYAVAWTVGLLFVIPLILYLQCMGKIRTRGYFGVARTIREGKIILAANHPSLIEPIIISTMFVPLFLIFADSQWPFSVPDRRTYLPRFLWFVYWPFRCITVDRSNTGRRSATALRRIHFILSAGRSVVMHPEGGRTDKGKLFVTKGKRRLRRITQTHVVKLARETSARIMPVWVDFSCTNPDGSLMSAERTLQRFLRDGMSISFGEPYTVNPRTPLEQVNRELEQRILSA